MKNEKIGQNEIYLIKKLQSYSIDRKQIDDYLLKLSGNQEEKFF